MVREPAIDRRPFGDRAELITLPDLGSVLALDAAARAAGLDRRPEVADLVPGARTLLVVARSPRERTAVEAAVTAVLEAFTTGPAHRPPLTGRPASAPLEDLVVPVRYDGPDLADVAVMTGLGPDGVIAAHTARPWTVAFSGFAPGFGYLVDGDPRLRVPRQADPRAAVPAGAVALAGEYRGIYPRRSPGGWQVIGHTDLVLWDAARTPPALLVPGRRVRFVAVGAAEADRS